MPIQHNYQLFNNSKIAKKNIKKKTLKTINTANDYHRGRHTRS